MAAAILMLVPVRAVGQGGGVPHNNEVQGPDIVAPRPETLVDTPGHKIDFNQDGTVENSENTTDGVHLFTDGTLTTDDSRSCEKGEVSHTRECRRIGFGAYVFVDIDYQLYTCGGKKGRAIKSFKLVKDVDGNAAPCFGYQYNEQATTAAQWGEVWEVNACIGDGTVNSPQGLVRAITITDEPNGTSIWMDMAGHEFFGWYDPTTGEGFWDAPGKPPRKPSDTNNYQMPGGAEKIDLGPDGTKHAHYPNGTDIYLKPNGGVEQVNPDGSKTVFDKPDPFKEEYKMTKYPPGSSTTNESPGSGEVQKSIDQLQKAVQQDPSAAQDLMKGPPPSERQGSDKTPAAPQSSGTGMNTPAKPANISKAEFATALAATHLIGRTSCPPPKEVFQRQPVSETIQIPSFAISTDSPKLCTYGDGMRSPRILQLVERRGLPTNASEAVTPALPSDAAIRGDDKNMRAVDRTRNTPPTDKPPQQAPANDRDSKPAAPSDEQTSAKSADVPQQYDEDEIETYDKETVEKDGHTESGSDLQGQLIMLVYAKPTLPGGGEKAALDRGFDRDPAKCVITDGHCRIHVRPDDRTVYGLPTSNKQPARYRVDLNDMKHSSGIAEITGKAVPTDLSRPLPAGVKLATQIFTIGARTFMVFNFSAPHNNSDDLPALLSRTIGIAMEINWCDDDKPAAEIINQNTMTDTANDALPGGVITLERTAPIRKGG